MHSGKLPYHAAGLVIQGFGRGSKALGIPTANLSEDVVNSLPEGLDTGIYYGWAALNGKIYKMVTSIGWNPFYKNEKKTMEVHLLDQFCKDFYGEKLKVILTGYIRPEKDFNSVQDLINEIKHDIAIAKEELQKPCYAKYKDDPFLVLETS